MKKKILLIVGILVIAGFGIYKYAYKPQRNIATEKAIFEIASNDFILEIAGDNNIANSKYMDKTISIYGKITNIDFENNAIVIDNKIYITFIDAIQKSLSTASPIKVKARYIGFDDLLSEYRMDQGTILE